jgi:hypothetical protein
MFKSKEEKLNFKDNEYVLIWCLLNYDPFDQKFPKVLYKYDKSGKAGKPKGNGWLERAVILNEIKCDDRLETNTATRLFTYNVEKKKVFSFIEHEIRRSGKNLKAVHYYRLKPTRKTLKILLSYGIRKEDIIQSAFFIDLKKHMKSMMLKNIDKKKKSVKYSFYKFIGDNLDKMDYLMFMYIENYKEFFNFLYNYYEEAKKAKIPINTAAHLLLQSSKINQMRDFFNKGEYNNFVKESYDGTASLFDPYLQITKKHINNGGKK